jgi:preprotein translocase subunit Sss1
MTPEEQKLLRQAKSNLENIGLIMSGVNYVGDKLESTINYLPKTAQSKVSKIAQNVLLKVMKTNLLTMHKDKPFKKPKSSIYKTSVTASGIGLGFLGFVGFSADLLFTTKMMMRSILDIARSKGEDIHTTETQLECLTIFALGGTSKEDDGLETSYYAIRMGLRTAIDASSKYITENGLKTAINKLATSAPIMQLITKITTRFKITALEKFAAEGIPIAGAIGAGTLNLVFMNHFQKMADAHFTIKQLEKKYGEEQVKIHYKAIIEE